MTKLNDLKSTLLQRPDLRAEYEALDEEFSIAEALIRARAGADMTQEQVAEKMQTSQSYVAKLESGRVSPSMKSLQRYAAATGARLKISFEQAVAP
ncbi:MAG: helix-turn-helix domain-containing protein [Hoeflea sp.]|uniref:helix-turn-helix domain-containing protein n=1 Tax=Hoeflea sp. TaxID=1940281 RepID=UPI001DB12BF7|nr:helix-turn-helix transcriptional regulator [Hoeflea sp.]MBU4527964.1 helix-turn-helix domain-containing protein [Alphaproteobacteria bacterium]MBU4546001.1 helix-turn-helix domain-containing protein [Alphaproteobacteria bacterium]MBU4553314.1 helix-turn-helix domain-containing protein [Alphaproteobacteria bacterium]MBV1724388.1 helix-turn-helix domain-containing protein [Hoeflea sp.]MBV1763384.1 helix-turn-helix domain-containing protein [Hoeflea sp.]